MQCILQHSVLSAKSSLNILLNNLEFSLSSNPENHKQDHKQNRPISSFLKKKLFMTRLARHWTRLARKVNASLLEVSNVSLSNLL